LGSKISIVEFDISILIGGGGTITSALQPPTILESTGETSASI
jgi:hypothetical protein